MERMGGRSWGSHGVSVLDSHALQAALRGTTLRAFKGPNYLLHLYPCDAEVQQSIVPRDVVWRARRMHVQLEQRKRDRLLCYVLVGALGPWLADIKDPDHQRPSHLMAMPVSFLWPVVVL